MKNQKKKILTKQEQQKINEDKMEFFYWIENTYMTIEEAINRTMTKNPGKYTKKDIVAWLRERMKNKQLSAQVLVKIKAYLNGLENDKER